MSVNIVIEYYYMNNIALSDDSTISPDGVDLFTGEKSVLKTLVIIRDSVLPLEEKDALRNMFLDYAAETDENKKTELRENILQKINSHSDSLPTLTTKPNQSTPTSVKSADVVEEKSSPTLGVARLTPEFQQLTPDKTTASVSGDTRTSQPLPEAETQTPPSIQPNETEDIVPSPAPAQAQAEPVKKKDEEPPVSTPTSSQSTDLKGRINEIKHDINSRVGNPINLIDANEEIGREYMSALLGAMKSVSGAGGELDAAKRLEVAYKAALEVARSVGDKTKNTGSTESSPTAAVQQEEPVAWQTEVSTEEAPAEESSLPATIEDEPAQTTKNEPDTATPQETIPDTDTTEPKEEKTSSTTVGLYHRPIDEAAERTQKTGSGLSGLLFKKGADKEPETTNVAPKTKAETSVKKLNINEESQRSATRESEKLKPLDESTALPEKIEGLRETAKKRAEAAKQPITDLNAPEVQQGLERLLSEWSLFKKSGLFGIGPAGINHPLYKKLSGLPMAAVVSGRFEGSNPQIKQSLSDYMNGWRYEQGIIHEMGESFEHYLRRVIKKILTKQRMMPASVST